MRAVGSPLDVSAFQILFYITARATGGQHRARPAGLSLGLQVCVAETAALTAKAAPCLPPCVTGCTSWRSVFSGCRLKRPGGSEASGHRQDHSGRYNLSHRLGQQNGDGVLQDIDLPHTTGSQQGVLLPDVCCSSVLHLKTAFTCYKYSAAEVPLNSQSKHGPRNDSFRLLFSQRLGCSLGSLSHPCQPAPTTCTAVLVKALFTCSAIIWIHAFVQVFYMGVVLFGPAVALEAGMSNVCVPIWLHLSSE